MANRQRRGRAWGELAGLYLLATGGAAILGSSCHFQERSGGLRCDPVDPSACLVDEERCCSDDPAALDLDDLAAMVTPHYSGHGGVGMPLFSAHNNDSSRSGLCVRLGSVPTQAALRELAGAGCPVPCNPTWSTADVTAVCGSGALCCQTVEIEPEDCVLDPAVGADGCWRPVTGADIVGLGGLEVTIWGRSQHPTAQDPGGLGCNAFVEGVAGTLADEGLDEQEVLQACYRRLTVANARGFCMGGPGVDGCPMAEPGYRDACEQLNDAEGRTGCAGVEFP